VKLENLTDKRPRWYDDACGTALALEFVGERWSLLVIRELVYGPRRFGEIRANLPGISANVLTQRLEGLEAAAILVKRRLPSPANVQVYELTDWGREAAPLIRDLGRWAARSPRHDPMLFMSPASAMMSLEAMMDRDKAARVTLAAAFRFPGDAFVAEVADGRIAIRRGEGERPDAVFTGDTMQMRMTVYGKLPLGAPEGLSVEGGRAAAQAFVDLFRLPEKIG
jgi:DNA-binding HxlR family transcriptional regulator